MPVATWPATSGAARAAVVRTSPRKCAGAWVGRDMGRRCVSRDCGRAPIGRRALAPGRGGRLCYRPSGKARDTFAVRSEEHTSELQSLMRISYAVFCLKINYIESAHVRTPVPNVHHV